MRTNQWLAIDQGTHATRALVFDDRGDLLAVAHCPVAITRAEACEVEQSAQEILRSVQAVIRQVLGDRAVDPTRIQAAGLATQRSSVVAWDRISGAPLSAVISWQDRRAEPALAALADQAPEIARRTGLRLSPHYGAGKLQWLLTHDPAVQAARRARRLLLGPLAGFLAYRLVHRPSPRVDDANASRTLLWNLARRDWDEYLLALFGIPRSLLPDCRPIVDRHGLLRDGAVALTAINGDQTAALYAQGRPDTTTLIVNIGTGAFVLLPVTDPGDRPPGLLAGVSHSDGTGCDYYLEGTVNGAGAAVDWLAGRTATGDLQQCLQACMAYAAEPPVFVNTIGGLGSPWWCSGPPPAFLDEPADAGAAMLGVIESIVFLLSTNIRLLCAHRPEVRRIRISGGLAALDGLCQRLADLTGLEVCRAAQTEATARGIAWQAAGGPLHWRTLPDDLVCRPGVNAPLRRRYERLMAVLPGAGDTPAQVP